MKCISGIGVMLQQLLGLFHPWMVMGQLSSILRSTETSEGQKVDGGLGEPTAWFPVMPIVPQSFPETGWGGSEREGGSWTSAIVSACWLGP